MISTFKGVNSWLSNFEPCYVEYEGLAFICVEAAYVAAKTLDIATRKEVQALPDGRACKKFGRTIKVRSDWEDIRLPVMKLLISQKFGPGTALGQRLIATGGCEIVEGNWWGDTFWGVCNGAGHNNLGKLIMEQRLNLLTYLSVED